MTEGKTQMKDVKDIKRVTCFGGGMIGSSWALNFAMYDREVMLYDVSDESLELASNRIQAALQILKKNGVMDDDRVAAAFSRIHMTKDPQEALTGTNYIQESGPENFPAKHGIVDLVEKYAPADAIYGSSTSYMNISDICANALHRERYIGAHPYNPPHLIPLVELTKHDGTDPAVLQLAYDFFKSIHKEPVVLLKESLGFISNRLQSVLTREMADLINRGVCSAEDCNKAVTYGPGMRWAVAGPHLIFELANAKGYGALLQNIKGSGINVLTETATWTETPKEVFPKILDGIEQMKAHMPDEIGHTIPELSDWRDDMLIGILKLHHKI